MAEREGQEKRRRGRIQVFQRVTYRPRGSALNLREPPRKAFLMDLSGGGMGIVLPEVCQVGTLLDVSLPTRTGPLVVPAQVIRKGKEPRKGWHIHGLRFTPQSPQVQARLGVYLDEVGRMSKGERIKAPREVPTDILFGSFDQE